MEQDQFMVPEWLTHLGIRFVNAFGGNDKNNDIVAVAAVFAVFCHFTIFEHFFFWMIIACMQRCHQRAENPHHRHVDNFGFDISVE